MSINMLHFNNKGLSVSSTDRKGITYYDVAFLRGGAPTLTISRRRNTGICLPLSSRMCSNTVYGFVPICR